LQLVRAVTGGALPRRLDSAQPEEERARWRVVRLDTCAPLDGDIYSADADSGVAEMRERGPDEIKDGVRKPTYRFVTHQLGPGGIAIVRRR
jgi:hypothetical protein